MRNKILIVGGQGNVGSQIARNLLSEEGYVVDVTSRSGRIRNKMLMQLHKNPGVVRLDLNGVMDYQFLDGYTGVIMCVDNENENFFNECIRRNILYIDITADMKIVSRSRIAYQRTQNYSTVVFGAGLAPGFSNLLADQALRSLDLPEVCHISMIFGTGDKHGKSAVEWMVNQLKENYLVRLGGKKTVVRPFVNRRGIDLLSTNESHSVFNFNFSDQHIVDELHNLKTITTSVAYDSKLMTGFMYGIARIGLLKILKNESIYRVFVNSISRMTFGSDKVIIHIEASGKKSGRNVTKRIEVTSVNESLITARIASELLIRAIKFNEPGFHYMSELFDLEDFKEILNEYFEYYDNMEVMG